VTQEERLDTRDRSYSAWHRRNSTRRFVGIEDAQLLAMIDLDASLYVEYDDGDKEPLALIETAIDVGQSFKTATVTTRLAQLADLPCFVVLYKLADEPNPADHKRRDICSFRVRQLHPKPENGKWVTVTPAAWARYLRKLRRDRCGVLDQQAVPA